MGGGSKLEVFISYSRPNRRTAYRLADDLARAKVDYWIDRERLESGDPLLDKLQAVLKKTRALALLWSRAASRSRFVKLEWQAAFYLKKRIIPCPLDETGLPPFLLPLISCDFRKSYKKGFAEMLAALHPSAKKHPRPRAILPSPPENGGVQVWIRRLSDRQNAILKELASHGPSAALLLQRQLDPQMKGAVSAHRDHPDILSLAGYHLKNAYLIKHWKSVQARREQPDPLLEKSESFFYSSLAIRPQNPSAMNGLGSILMLRRNLDAAEFYVRHAIAEAGREGFRYDAAEHDLKLIQRLKGELTGDS
jgi:hypothetical protein